MNDNYAVIYTDTIYHEGDERSRTHPGHGYPAYSEDIQKIQTFNSEDALKEWILNNVHKKYQAIKYTKLKYETRLVIV